MQKFGECKVCGKVWADRIWCRLFVRLLLTTRFILSFERTPLLWLSFLQITLSVKRRWEWVVVKGTGNGIGSLEGRHSTDTVLCLVWGQLFSQLLGGDVWLKRKKSIKIVTFCKIKSTLSLARMRKESIICSAVSVSVLSRVIKSRKASKATKPVPLGSTCVIMRRKSLSPWRSLRML